MLFLETIYRHVESSLGGVLNHFPLVKLVFYSLDKTIFYFIFWMICRSIWLFIKKRRGKQIDKKRESILWLFVFYMILLFSLTVFRGIYFIWDIHLNPQPLSNINVHLFSETFKLKDGVSKVDFLYNFVGNIIWFIPFGFLLPYLSHWQSRFWETVFFGLLISFTIETLQFLLYTGISDVDDLVFNTLGAVIGYLLHIIVVKIFRKHRGKI